MKKSLFYLALIILLCATVLLAALLIRENRVDRRPPTISFSDAVLELSTRDPEQAYLQGVTAEDNVDGDVTDSLVVASVQLINKDGTIDVTYAAFDAAGNVTKAVRRARYTDYESPRFDLSRSPTFLVNSDLDIFSIVKATDGFDGDISHRVRITALTEEPINSLGVHRLLMSVSNSLGETVTVEIPLEFYANGSYNAELTLTDYMVYLPLGTELDSESFLDTFTTSGGSVSLRNGLPEGYSLNVTSDVQSHEPGVYTVEYRVTRAINVGGGTGTYTGYAKLIVVVEG